MLPFLAQRYETAKFSRAVPYALYELEDTPYDTVILEIAERNLRNLLMSAPIMPAPLTEEAEAPLETDAVLKTRTVNGYRHYYGYLEEADAQMPGGFIFVCPTAPMCGTRRLSQSMNPLCWTAKRYKATAFPPIFLRIKRTDIRCPW